LKINIVYLAEPKFGGWVTLTEHLYKCLKLSGHDVQLFKTANRFSQKPKHFSGDVFAFEVTKEALSELRGAIIVPALDKHHISDARFLEKQNVIYNVSDPTELGDERMYYYQRARKLFGNGFKIVSLLKSKGFDAELLPHPYAPFDPTIKKNQHAVAFSRIDFDKYTNIICAANQILPFDLRCNIYGSENRLYTYFKLNSQYPNWRKHYHGEFPRTPGAGSKLASKSAYSVDMSAIKGDGGRTQYTFFEAWDGYSCLILNKEWTGNNDDELRSGFNCLSVKDGNELAAVLRNDPPSEIIENGRTTLAKHGPTAIESVVLNAFK
jgi:hypothetical protein